MEQRTIDISEDSAIKLGEIMEVMKDEEGFDSFNRAAETMIDYGHQALTKPRDKTQELSVPLLRVNLYLETGSTMEFICRKFKTERNEDGQLTRMTWSEVPGHISLKHVNLGKVVGVVVEPVVEEGDSHEAP
ncbi:hypothetical protein [Paenibacillus sp. GbtcB18]|uniref:hypothetical protein n=1 Tax=Paenibacillus sp. GbtcB18 TaxID=2824763 RepID=UPI001C2F9F3B|nr:hypothetical protein [Paenibacillus sp. GbtcB18]